MSAFFHGYWSRRNRADQAAQRAHKLLRQHTDLETPPLLELAMAMRCLLAGDFKGRDEAIRRAATSSVAGLDPAVPVLLALGHADILLAHGADSEARAILQQIDGPLPPLLALQRDLLLAGLDMSLGRPRAALRLLRAYKDGPFGVIVAVPCARALLALNDVDGALTRVRKVLTTPSNQAGRYTLIDALLCEAQIIQDRGEPGAALELLVRALDVARDEITLPFVLATRTFAGLLARHPDAAARWPAPVAGLPAPRAPGDRAAPAASLPEPLTEREFAVLRFLATSMSNSEIADELCLSVNTVKTHLAAIYRKLPARQRREAVLRARELELI